MQILLEGVEARKPVGNLGQEGSRVFSQRMQEDKVARIEENLYSDYNEYCPSADDRAVLQKMRPERRKDSKRNSVTLQVPC